MRILRYIEPPRIFITQRPHEDEHEQEYWIRNCTPVVAARAFELLKCEAVTPHIRSFTIKQRNDLVDRASYYKTYIVVRVRGHYVTEENLPAFKPLIAAAFRTVQGTHTQWLTINKFLNLRVWHRRQLGQKD